MACIQDTITRAPSLFINTGTLEKIGGTGNSTIGWNFDSEGGTLETPVGIFSFSGNWTGGGLVFGNATVLGNIGGIIGSNAVINWSGGDLEGSLTVAQGGTLTISNTRFLCPGQLVLRLHQHGNAGQLRHCGLGGDDLRRGKLLRLGGGRLIDNAGLWESVADNTMSPSYEYTSTNSLFVNTGTLEKTGGTGTSTIAWNFDNDDGTVLPLDGTVGFNNGLNLTNGLLNFAISGPSSFGQISVSGTANLTGTLSANLDNGYSPSVGISFQLITYGSESGVFANLNLPALATGLGWQVLYGAGAVSLQVVSSTGLPYEITGVVTNNLGVPVTNLTVFAYTTNSGGNIFLSTTTDANGHYVLNASNSVWSVGLEGLIARGYNDVSNQDAVVNDANQTVNFLVQPYTGPTYTITVAANPAAGGSVSGGGVFPSGSPVTLIATANTNTQPYFFTGWTEDGILQSTADPFVFLVQRDQQLVANFTLPEFTISASNNPPVAGSVTGTGTYFYGSSCTLTAQPDFGYNFSFWSQGVNVVSTEPMLTFLVYSNNAFVANYVDANTNHLVTTATQPPGLATVTGAGDYTNGQSGLFSAPAIVVRFTLRLHFSRVHAEWR